MEAEEARLLQPLSLLPSLPPLFENIPADNVFGKYSTKAKGQQKTKPKPHIPTKVFCVE
jgi:hypothetical protein